VGSTRDGQTREAEAGEAEVAASDSGGNGGAERDNVNDEAGHAQPALEADEAADSIRLQLTVRELLL
jgi:hypothetical protein